MTEGRYSALGTLEARAAKPHAPLRFHGVRGGSLDLAVAEKGDIDLRLGPRFFDGTYDLRAGGGGFSVDVAAGTPHAPSGPGRGKIGNGSVAAGRPYGYTQSLQTISAATADGAVRLRVSEAVDPGPARLRPTAGELYPCLVNPALPGCIIVAADCTSCPRPMPTQTQAAGRR